MFTKIAVPLDGSSFAEEALPFAIKLANSLSAKLVLLNVTQLPTPAKSSPEKEMKAVQYGESYLNGIRNIITNGSLVITIPEERVQALAVYGDPKTEIADTALLEETDLIVMTTHGRGGLSRLLMGSVAAAVVKNAAMPVVLIKPVTTSTPRLWEEIMNDPATFSTSQDHRILIPLDGTVEAETAIAPALDIAKELKAPVNLLQVLNPLVSVGYNSMTMGYHYINYNSEKEVAYEKQQAEGYLSQLSGRFNKEKIPCSVEVRIGKSATGIVDCAREIKATLVVMAIHNRGRFEQALLGSVSQEVLKETHLPVMVVRTLFQGIEHNHHVRELNA